VVAIILFNRSRKRQAASRGSTMGRMPRELPPDDINPYASPTVPNSCSDPDIGVWRDGEYLVIHTNAHLPPICIETGQPATHTWNLDLTWNYPIDWSTRVLRMRLPLCRNSYHKHMTRRFFCALAFIVPISCWSGSIFLFQGNLPDTLFWGLVGLSISGMVMGALILRDKPLRFVRVSGRHLWLRGASPLFLEKLPEWGAD
jgi:hypothetical protein